MRLTANVGAVLIVSMTLSLPKTEANAAFPGRNGVIAFSTCCDRFAVIRVINPDGTHVGRLVRGEEPQWSADGTRLVFRCARKELKGICILQANGSVSVLIMHRLPRTVESPSWSPDGTRIAFDGCNFLRTRCDIYVINTDGSGLTRLTKDGFFNASPAWSPDGTRIAFSHDARISTMAPDGSDFQVLSEPRYFGDYPEWSPDSSMIAWIHTDVYGARGEIFVMNADGTDQRDLTQTPGLEEDATLSWSPDGTQIAFTAKKPGDLGSHSVFGSHYQLFVMNSDGTGRIRLTKTPIDKCCPAWQPLL